MDKYGNIDMTKGKRKKKKTVVKRRPIPRRPPVGVVAKRRCGRDSQIWKKISDKFNLSKSSIDVDNFCSCMICATGFT